MAMPLSPIHRLYRSIESHFHPLFWPVLAAVFVVVFLQLKDQTYLQNDIAPNGLPSLEMAGTYDRDSAIIRPWKRDTLDVSSVTLCQRTPRRINRLQKARFDLHLDYVLILLYILLGGIVLAALQTRVQLEQHWVT